MGKFWAQYKAILFRNIKMNLQKKQYLRENMAVVILTAFILFSELSSPNNFMTPFYLAVAILSYSRVVTLVWVTQKQTYQKQLQKIMGVSQEAYYLSWLTYFLINGLFVSFTTLFLFNLLVVQVGGVNISYSDGYSFIHIVVLYFVFCISTIGLTIFLCTFFGKAKTAAQGVTFIQLILNFMFFLRLSPEFSHSKLYIALASISPQACFNFGLSSMSFINSRNGFPKLDTSYQECLLEMIVTGMFFLLFALYLDQVWPNQMGTNKPPLFFLQCFKKQRKQPSQLSLIQEEEFETSAKYQQPMKDHKKQIIKMKNVSKSFGHKLAVDNLSIKFYQSEIFCLLGHNGAGKSTSINLLTGMLKSSKGLIELMGLNYHDNLNQIRQNIGLCLQHNVLYDDLSIEDHLNYYYQIKGLPLENMDEEVSQTIQKCALGGQRGKLSKNLSGGNKRKLCLANSLIGGSKIVFLDEPSSGLDPNSRQSIWGIMKRLQQQNRCIILTTHHLQQAEQLAQRIGIMSQGKLIIVGDCNFVKEKFNVGYHLIVTLKKNSEESREKIRKIIKQYAKSAQQDQQSASNTLKFILSMKQADKYSELFKTLEQANLGELSLKMSSLQDAFIKLGAQQMSSEGNSSVPDLPDMELPQVKCQYNFWSQFQAVFKKKGITLYRSFGSIVSVLLPVIFITLGVTLVVFLITGQSQSTNYIKRYIISYFMVWAFVFNTSSYCGSIVLERQKRFKYLSNVMGVRKMPYWMGNYTLDLIIFFIPLIVFFAILFAAGQRARFLTDIAGYLILTLLVFGFSFIGYSYLFSFVFQKSNTAYRFFPFFNLFFLYFIPQIPSFIWPQGLLAQYVMPTLSPFIAFSNNFFTIEILGPINVSGFKSKSYTFNILCMIVQGVVYLLATLYVQDLRFSLKGDRNGHLIQQNQNQEDEIKFHQNIEQPRRSTTQQNKPIFIQNLTKVYSNGYRAIRNNSFSVKNGQIFGLLGPNGAGKSTTFNIATAALSKSSGTVKLFNQQVNKGILQIFQNVGVCPQYDAIYNQLTTEQHLQYFCRIKGLPKESIASTIDFYCQLLSLKPFKKVKAGQLSGGNKRKLCVSMAMIGNPQILFCDEPSSGVDPVSRRYLWKALALAAKTKNTSMVLTTHSMNEAQSLCSRIGILIKGKFVCLDTPKGLKNVYGEGYRVSITADVSKHQRIIDLIQKQIGKQATHEIIPRKPEQILFKIPSQKFVLSKIYYIFHNSLWLKKEISRYQIKESSLQQVFIHLSKMQPQVQEQKYEEPWQILCWEWGKNGCFRL